MQIANDNDDIDDTIVTDNLTECNEWNVNIIETRKNWFLDRSRSLKAMTPTKRKMYKIHRRTINKLCKIKKSLYSNKNALKKITKAIQR